MAITIDGSGITSANIADGTIVNGDIHPGAAISGSKLTGVTPTKSAIEGLGIAASSITGALPAISGAALTGVGKRVLQVYRSGMGGSTTTTSQAYVDIGNAATFTPIATGSTLVISHGCQIWYGSNTAGSGDVYMRFLLNGSPAYENNRAWGNFDGGQVRTHKYIINDFTYVTTSTSAITIQLQALLTGTVPGGLNFYHTTSAANQIIIVEYAS